MTRHNTVFVVNTTGKHAIVPVGELGVMVPAAGAAWAVETSADSALKTAPVCSHGHKMKVHHNDPSGNLAAVRGHRVVLHSPHVHACSVHDGVWKSPVHGSSTTLDGVHVLKLRWDGVDTRHTRGEFLALRQQTVVRNMLGTKWTVDITRGGDDAWHVFVHEAPAVWHGLAAAHDHGDIVRTAGGHTGVDGVLDAAQHFGASLDMYGVPRDVNGAMLHSGIPTPGRTLFTWDQAAHACAMNGGCANTPYVEPRPLTKGLLHHGVSTGDPEVFVSRQPGLQQVNVAVSGKRHFAGMAQSAGPDKYDINVPPSMIHVGTALTAPRDYTRGGVVECPRLPTDILRAAAARAHIQEELSAFEHAPSAAMRSAGALSAGAATSVCTPTLDSGSGTPNCGDKTSDAIAALAISAIVKGSKQNSDAKSFCKAVQVLGAADAAKNNAPNCS